MKLVELVEQVLALVVEVGAAVDLRIGVRAEHDDGVFPELGEAFPSVHGDGLIGTDEEHVGAWGELLGGRCPGIGPVARLVGIVSGVEQFVCPDFTVPMMGKGDFKHRDSMMPRCWVGAFEW